MPEFPSSIDARIEQVNQRLKMARLGVQVERRSQKLSLRATLPPRPGSDRIRPHQQRLSLNLPATTVGLKQAEQEAKILAAQLLQKTFDWRPYLGGSGVRLSPSELVQTIQAFERDFFSQPRRRKQVASATTTWDTAYAPYFRKLLGTVEANPQFSLEEAIQATVRSMDETTRSRQVCCTAFKALERFLNLDLTIDLKALSGTYGPGATQARALPSDELILETFEKISNPAWRFVYGVMAAYGLRNHEVFFCDYTALSQPTSQPTLRVLSTSKTGSHEVWPFYPEWVDRFGLRQVCLPEIETDLQRTTLQRVGQFVTVQFRRYRLPFSPYDLRHAWAVRTIHLGLPDTIAARMMGHSVAIHTRTYHQWMTHRDHQRAVDDALSRMGYSQTST